MPKPRAARVPQAPEPADASPERVKIARPKSLKDLVVEEIRRRIIYGSMQLGTALSENALAADLGLSKTPVREALQQLRLEGLVDVQPQRGTYVFRLSAEQVAMISELREILEVAAATAAMERNRSALVRRLAALLDAMRAAQAKDDAASYRTLDGAFHEAIIELGGNPYIASAYGPVGFRIQALRTRLSHDARLNRSSIEEHRQMLAFARAGDIAGLQRLLRRHIRQTRESYLEVLARQESGGESGAA
ncbi:MAG: GntR family transcriptional regulator [Alphaproteobacteria bacterium]|nr:GntR family transcriptional regulator [Alphaproteobacteria bacterium]